MSVEGRVLSRIGQYPDLGVLVETLSPVDVALEPPPLSGTLPPIVIGMTPGIGPPLAAEAGVTFVWLAPALAGAGVHLRCVMPCTCADVLVGGTRASADTARSTDKVREG